MAKIKLMTPEGQEAEFDLSVDQLPKEIKDDIIKQATGITYGNIDAKLESMGFQKVQGEKTSDFMERIVKEQLGKIEDLDKAKPDITKFQNTIDELKTDLKETKLQLKNKDGEISAKLLEKELQSQVKMLVKDITIPNYLTEPDEIESFTKMQEQLILNKLNTGYKVKEVDGKIQFLQDDAIVENADRDIASIKDVINKDFGFMFKKVEPPKGNPNGGNTKGKPDGTGPKTKASSYEEAVNLVRASNPEFMAGSKEFFAVLGPILEENGLSD